MPPVAGRPRFKNRGYPCRQNEAAIRWVALFARKQGAAGRGGCFQQASYSAERNKKLLWLLLLRNTGCMQPVRPTCSFGGLNASAIHYETFADGGKWVHDTG